MTKQKNSMNKAQAGFTLVELAIVMIIIGLLIGGVLKGQELINNAQITSTIAQIKGIDAATSTFRDMYSALPGDIVNPSTRLPNCDEAPCSTSGNGNGRLSTIPSAQPSGETVSYFVHLNAADLVTGINPTITNPGSTWGGYYPETSIAGSGLHVGSAAAAGDLSAQSTGARAGIYLTLTSAPGAAPNTSTLTPNQAARIDGKLDDGQPAAGSVRAPAGNCSADGVYTETAPDLTCYLQIRIQG